MAGLLLGMRTWSGKPYQYEKSIMQNEPQRHHYIPRHYLENFSVSSGKFETLKKEKNRLILSKPNIRSLGMELGYNKFNFDGKIHSLEEKFAKDWEDPFTNSNIWQQIKEFSIQSSDDVFDISGGDINTLLAYVSHLRDRLPERILSAQDVFDVACGAKQPDHPELLLSDIEVQQYSEIGSKYGGGKAFNLIMSDAGGLSSLSLSNCGVFIYTVPPEVHSDASFLTHSSPIFQNRWGYDPYDEMLFDVHSGNIEDPNHYYENICLAISPHVFLVITPWRNIGEIVPVRATPLVFASINFHTLSSFLASRGSRHLIGRHDIIRYTLKEYASCGYLPNCIDIKDGENSTVSEKFAQYEGELLSELGTN